MSSSRLRPHQLMVVGAICRDIIQSALGHTHVLRATEDIDVALATPDWEAYDELVAHLTPAGDTGVRFRVAGTKADLLPFGRVEDPTGSVQPPAREEEMSVWAFQEVFDASLPLPLPGAGIIRIPTVPGYVALKMAAWLDRSAVGQDKDAPDLAAGLYWYTESAEIRDSLYDTEHGHRLLVSADADPDLAAVRLLGEDVARVIGPERQAEMARRWPGGHRDALARAMNLVGAARWSRGLDRRRALLAAMESGLEVDRATPRGRGVG